jgi:hypothetical protein
VCYDLTATVIADLFSRNAFILNAAGKKVVQSIKHYLKRIFNVMSTGFTARKLTEICRTRSPMFFKDQPANATYGNLVQYKLNVI